MAKEFKDLVFALDIGTAKVMVVAAEVLHGGELRVVGLGVAPTHGLKRGVVVNIDATVQSIQQALKEAEMMAACKIDRVYTGITGSHIRGQNSTGMVIVRDNREVTPVDVSRVVETAKAINIPGDQRLSASLAPIAQQVQTLRLSSRGSWQAELAGGAKLELGRGTDDEVVARVDRLARTLAQVNSRFGDKPRALVAADLRHPDGYALRLAGITTAAQQNASTK